MSVFGIPVARLEITKPYQPARGAVYRSVFTVALPSAGLYATLAWPNDRPCTGRVGSLAMTIPLPGPAGAAVGAT